MSIQVQFDKEALNEVSDIHKRYLQYTQTILRFFMNYKKPFDSLTMSERKEFKKELEAILEFKSKQH